MVRRYFDGVLPEPTDHGPAEQALADKLAATVTAADKAIDTRSMTPWPRSTTWSAP
jgi:methionyl-tRNA synthetase